MKRILKLALAGVAAAAMTIGSAGIGPAFAQMKEKEKTVTVGGAPMYPSKNIVQNAVNSKDHTTLVAAVKAAGLVDTLQSPGPFTVFAPTNDAFAKLPAGTVDTLLKPENKKTLTNVLTYHVVAGRLTANDLMEKIKAGNGKAMLKTVEGADLTFAEKDGKLWIWDAKGDSAQVTIRNVMQSNGVIHVIDTVLLPG
ncbi:MAG TPA: fasciclin domain-containing protein [Pseudolabrys sp.]|nr:fasciclin domain-containing protein [Pseudolabrys sp.]